MRTFLLSIGSVLLLAAPITAQDEPAKVGMIFIVGNERTPDSEIRKHLDIFPGQFLEFQKIRAAEDKLANTGYFVVDSAKKIKPRISVIEDANGPFRDLVVNVQELRPQHPNVVEPSTVAPSVIEPRRRGILRRWLPGRRI